MNVLCVYALHYCTLHMGNTADSSSLPFFFFVFQVVLLLRGVETQCKNEESLSMKILSHNKDAVSAGCPPAGRTD